MPPSGGSMYPRGNSRSATATPTGSPKRRLPQIPGQGLPPSGSASNRLASNSRGMRGAGPDGSGLAYHATSYDAGLNGRGQSLHPSTRSRSMGHYGGYSDTEVMMPPNSGGQYYEGGTKVGYDPYYENTRGPYPMEDRGPSSYPVEDRRAQPPPPPPQLPAGGRRAETETVVSNGGSGRPYFPQEYYQQSTHFHHQQLGGNTWVHSF